MGQIMTDRLQRLADMAMNIAPPDAVFEEEFGFTLDANGETLSFFAPGGETEVAYCRALVGLPDGHKCPVDFAEAALEGNLFWRGTEGAVLSLNLDENAVYLTDRFDAGAFADENEFRGYINGFLRTLFDWQKRFYSSLTETEVAR